MSNEKNLTLSEDRVMNGWNPPKDGGIAKKFKYILACMGPTALAASLCMGPGSINSTLQLGAYSGYSQFYLIGVTAILGALIAYISNYVMIGTHEPGEKALTMLQVFRREMPKPIAKLIALCVWIPFWFIILSMSSLLGATVNALFPMISNTFAMIIGGPIIALIFTRNMSGIKKIFTASAVILTVLFLLNCVMSNPSTSSAIAGMVPSAPVSGPASVAWSGVIGGAIVGGFFVSSSFANKGSGLTETKHLKLIRCDITVMYSLVFIFGASIFLSAAAVLNPLGGEVNNVIQAANVLGPVAGNAAKYIMLTGLLFAVIQCIGGIANLNTFITADVFGIEADFKKYPKLKWVTVAHCLLVCIGMIFKNFAPVQLTVYVMAINTFFGPIICFGVLYILCKKGVMKIKSPIWMKIVVTIVALINCMAVYNTILGLLS